MSLEFDGPIPLHLQLKQILKENILNGCYKKKIPSERELIEEFSVSRTTVRMAISLLVNEGVLEKSHGKGTFISNKPVQDWLGSLSSLTETINNMGMIPGTKLIHHGLVSPSEEIKEILKVKQIYLIERLRFANNIPIAIEKHYFSSEIGEQLEKYDLNKVVIYDLLESSIGLTLWKANQTITSGQATKHDSLHLDIPESSSVLLSERLMYDSTGNPIELLKSVFRPDMYSFNIEMLRTRE